MSDTNHDFEIVVDLPSDIAGWLDVLRHVKNKRNELDEVEKQARQKIQDALGDAEEGHVNGQPVVRWTRVTSRRLDQKLLKAKVDPAVLNDCYTEQTTRRFTLVDGGE